MVTRSQLEKLSQRIDRVTGCWATIQVEYEVHLHFDSQTTDEFLAEIAEKDPGAIWNNSWVSLHFDEGREPVRQFAAALKRARAAQIAAGNVPPGVRQSSFRSRGCALGRDA